MPKFDKFPVTRPLPDRDLLIKFSNDGVAVKGCSEENKESGVVICVEGKAIDSNGVVFWQYAENNTEPNAK